MAYFFLEIRGIETASVATFFGPEFHDCEISGAEQFVALTILGEASDLECALNRITQTLDCCPQPVLGKNTQRF